MTALGVSVTMESAASGLCTTLNSFHPRGCSTSGAAISTNTEDGVIASAWTVR